MRDDQLTRLALQRQVENSAEIEVQLRRDIPGVKPVLTMLAMARRQAADAMVRLVGIDPTDSKQITALQNEVRRFDELVEWTRGMIVQGFEAEKLLNEGEVEEVRDLMLDALAETETDDQVYKQEGQDADS